MRWSTLLLLAAIACRKGPTDEDGDGFLSDVDCDDVSAAVNPDAPEVCNDLDDDCDGLTDVNATDAKTFYADGDMDGFGGGTTALACAAPTDAYTETGGDCDDAAPNIHPDAEESDCTDPVDYNCDGSVGYDDADADGWPACKDCDDASAQRNPAAVEVCNDADDDCDGDTDANAIDAAEWFADADADGFGDPEVTTLACEMPETYVANDNDCDDTLVEVHPGADELCNDTDDNCNAVVDEDPVDADTWYADADGDGTGGAATHTDACEAPAGYVASSDDCDDLRPETYPGAEEICDKRDNDCNGQVPASETARVYRDADADGYGDAGAAVNICDAGDGYVVNSDDCDDLSADTHPGAAEICDEKDNDCDGAVPATELATVYRDVDGDGYGDPNAPADVCDAGEDYVADNTDCDDLSVASHPGASEICDEKDNDCDGAVPASELAVLYRDTDGDGHGTAGASARACFAGTGYVAANDDCDDLNALTYTGAAEACDGKDNDCDGAVPSAETTDVFRDADGDGFGDAGRTARACAVTSGYAADDNDCDDTDGAINPGEGEWCDDLDNDCNGVIDDADQVYGEAPACVARHCADLFEQRPDAVDGVYWVSGADRQPFEAWCDMTTRGGGWTLALKADGRNTTFSYDAAMWTNGALYRSNRVEKDRIEAKLSPFVQTPFTELLAEIEAPIPTSGAIGSRNVVVPVSGSSLQALFAGPSVTTTLGRTAWKGLIANSSLQANCNAEGINQTLPGQRARIGILANQENDCGSPDSRLGIGTQGNNCATPDGLSVGNSARCGPDNGDKDIYGFGWVWLRCDPGAADTRGDGVDQNCDYVDGIDADWDGAASVASGGLDCNDADPDVLPGVGCDPLPMSCLDVKQSNSSAASGIYAIDPDGDGVSRDVYCDMATDGGGWTLVWKHSYYENGLPTDDMRFYAATRVRGCTDPFGGWCNEPDKLMIGLSEQRVRATHNTTVVYDYAGRISASLDTDWTGGILASPRKIADLCTASPNVFPEPENGTHAMQGVTWDKWANGNYTSNCDTDRYGNSGLGSDCRWDNCGLPTSVSASSNHVQQTLTMWVR